MKTLFVKSIRVLVIRARPITGVNPVTTLVKLKTVNHQVILVENRQAQRAMNVKLADGDHCVRIIAQKTVPKSVI